RRHFVEAGPCDAAAQLDQPGAFNLVQAHVDCRKTAHHRYGAAGVFEDDVDYREVLVADTQRATDFEVEQHHQVARHPDIESVEQFFTRVALGNRTALLQDDV